MDRYAVVVSGRQQLLVKEDDVIKVELVPCEKGSEITLDQVLILKNGEKTEFGQPLVAGAKVVCESLGDEKQPRVISFKYRRRKDSRRKTGSRQTLTVLKVKSISS